MATVIVPTQNLSEGPRFSVESALGVDRKLPPSPEEICKFSESGNQEKRKESTEAEDREL